MFSHVIIPQSAINSNDHRYKKHIEKRMTPKKEKRDFANV